MNLTGITDQVAAANSNTLGYSAANRLASASGPWGVKTHSYDGVGNRISESTTLGAATTNRTQFYSPSSNRLDNIWQNGALLQYYNHDAAGNMISLIRTGENFQYSYNKRNRLSSVTRNGTLWGTYVYNALEQLVSRTSNAPAAPLGTIHYIYDLDSHLIAEADGATGATLREYLWLPANDNSNDTLAETSLPQAELGGGARRAEGVPDLPLAVIDGVATASPTTSYIHTDHLGRPTRMTSATKATVWSATWTPWGEPQTMSGPVTNNLRFPGQYFQIETGLAYNWHRHYDPATGRYTQPDPLRFVDGPSVYAYAGNSPFVNVDREGLMAKKYVKPKNPNQRRGAENRQPGNERERNVKPPDGGEEHSVKPKGAPRPKSVPPRFKIPGLPWWWGIIPPPNCETYPNEPMLGCPLPDTISYCPAN